MSTALVGSVVLTCFCLQVVMLAVTFHLWTAGDWRRSWAGRILMSVFAAFIAVLGLGVIKAVAVDIFGAGDPAWFYILRLVVFTVLMIVAAVAQVAFWQVTHPVAKAP